MNVLQDWVTELTLMQQSVLLAAIRGPDTIRKDHPVKVLMRWYRRCILLSAFDKRVLDNPHEPGGGSFTGPMPGDVAVADLMKDYLRYIDEMPHHFQLHLMHSAEILGYKHPSVEIGERWGWFYRLIVSDAHLQPETREAMEWRLSDNEQSWRAAEVVVAHGSTSWRREDNED